MLIAASIAIRWHDDAPRYQLTNYQPGVVARMNVRNGSIDLCATRPYIQALLDPKDYMAMGLLSGMTEEDAQKMTAMMADQVAEIRCFELNNGKRP